MLHCARLILEEGARLLGVKAEEAEFDGERVSVPGTDRSVSRAEIGWASFEGHSRYLSACLSHSSPVSPPPFMAGMAEIDLDPETGKVQVVDYVAVVDCGTVINTNLARVQTEGGIVQAIGMTLYEDVQYDEAGRMVNDSFLQYKIPPGWKRVRSMWVAPSYEPTGPFGAKSIGELVINTPAPAIAEAVRRATGHMFRSLPIRSEDIALALAEERA